MNASQLPEGRTMSAETELKHAENFTARRNNVKLRGMGGYAPGQGASGYGGKISMDYMIHFDGDPAHRWYRVYQMLYSNSGTCYVIRGGEKVIVRGGMLEEALEKAGER